MYSQYRRNFEFKPLGKTYKGRKVSAIDRIYYTDYQYKLCLEGNRVKYDIIALGECMRLFSDNGVWLYRVQHTTKNINLYLNDKDMLDKILDYYQHTDFIQELWGPIDEEHVESLRDYSAEFVYRNKYWYGKYNIKILFYRGFVADENRAQEGKEIREFIEGSFDDYRLFDSYANSWYSNYLWLTQEEFDKGYPFLKLSYGEYIEKIQKVKLMEI